MNFFLQKKNRGELYNRVCHTHRSYILLGHLFCLINFCLFFQNFEKMKPHFYPPKIMLGIQHNSSLILFSWNLCNWWLSECSASMASKCPKNVVKISTPPRNFNYDSNIHSLGSFRTVYQGTKST